MPSSRWLLPSAMAVSALALTVGAALSDPPPADTVIGNQAVATYTSEGQTFTVKSNVVETVVNEIAAVDLVADQTRSGAPGGFVMLPHVITNDGNADDVFNLSFDRNNAGGTDTFALTDSDIQIFADADRDGVPDSLTPITVTPSILAGEEFGILVRADIPASVNPAGTPSTDFSVTATSAKDPTQSSTVVDVIEVRSTGVIDLQKVQSLAVDADGDGVFSEGDTVEVTLTYTNSGIAAATDVVIEDVLPVTNTDDPAEPITLSYLAGSGLWSDSGANALTDATDAPDPFEQTNTQGSSLDYRAAGGTITATLDTVGAGRSGEITFRYVLTDVPQGRIENVATVESDDQVETPSNPSPIEIAPTAEVGFSDAALNSFAGSAVGDDGPANSDANDTSTTDDGGIDDTVTDTDTTFPGARLPFDVVLTNLGDATDTMTIDVNNDDFPPGTTFEIVGADGVTPLVGNRITLEAGDVAHLQVIATLPNSTPTDPNPADFDATVTATSVTDPTATNAVGIEYAGVVEALPVDLVDVDADSGAPFGGVTAGNVDDGGAPWDIETILPGETAVFPLQVTVPAGAPANTFELAASTDPTFATETLPDGWTVEFFKDGQRITSTGSLAPTSSTDAVFTYEARVTAPEDAAATKTTESQPIYFQVSSPVNGAQDTILDGVSIADVVDLEVTSDTAVQAAPGGVVVIPHTLSNLGNVTLTGGAVTFTPGATFDANGFTHAIFFDANGDGELDAGDVVIDDLADIPGGLAPGEKALVFVRAQVPGSASFGLTESGTLSVADTLTATRSALDPADTTVETATLSDTNPDNNDVLDTISVISGDVVVTKRTAIDPTCVGPQPGTSYTTAEGAADPGDCIIYQITVDNTGTSPATDVIINDIVPDWTTIETCAGDSCEAELLVDGTATPIGVLPADEADGIVASSSTPPGFSLAPGARAVLTFTVQIDE